jgi:hypothetical protein
MQGLKKKCLEKRDFQGMEPVWTQAVDMSD